MHHRDISLEKMLSYAVAYATETHVNNINVSKMCVLYELITTPNEIYLCTIKHNAFQNISQYEYVIYICIFRISIYCYVSCMGGNKYFYVDIYTFDYHFWLRFPILCTLLLITEIIFPLQFFRFMMKV